MLEAGFAGFVLVIGLGVKWSVLNPCPQATDRTFTMWFLLPFTLPRVAALPAWFLTREARPERTRRGEPGDR